MKSLWARLGAAIVVGTFAAVTAQAQPVERGCRNYRHDGNEQQHGQQGGSAFLCGRVK